MRALPDICQETIHLQRQLDAAPSAVFAAYADPEVRVRWTAPSGDEVLVYSQTEFRPGGTDRFLCGPRSDPRYAGEVRYELIETDRLIVSHERVSEDGSPLSVANIVWRFEASGGGTLLSLSDQVTSLVGSSMVEGNRNGYEAALGNLERLLAGS